MRCFEIVRQNEMSRELRGTIRDMTVWTLDEMEWDEGEDETGKMKCHRKNGTKPSNMNSVAKPWDSAVETLTIKVRKNRDLTF